MKWLFTKGFVHGDVHARNIMLDVDRRKLVLIDFEGATITRDEDDPFDDIAALRKEVRAPS